MNGAEIYASKMLLLEPVSASALCKCSSLLTMILAAHNQLSDWLLREMILLAYFLVLKCLEEVTSTYFPQLHHY
jgi:hypothetical protein